MPARTAKRPLTDKQASYLRALQQVLDLPYTGDGTTVKQASVEIDRLRARLGYKPNRAKPVRTVRNPSRAEAILRAPKATARRQARKSATNPFPKREADESPTATQLHDLKVLCVRAGIEVPTVDTRGEAGALLARLKEQPKQP